MQEYVRAAGEPVERARHDSSQLWMRLEDYRFQEPVYSACGVLSRPGWDPAKVPEPGALHVVR